MPKAINRLPIQQTTNGLSIELPFSIAIDSREQLPYQFQDIKDNVDCKGRRPILIVPTVRCTLKTGDYSIIGYEDLITIERKSKEDLYGSISQNRDNFIGRLNRMKDLERAIIVVEASWDDLLSNPPHFTKFNPKSLSRTIQSWIIRYPVQWLMVPNRDYGEAFTFWLLRRFWIHKQDEKLVGKDY
jgi:ERCC4-type nuclease